MMDKARHLKLLAIKSKDKLGAIQEVAEYSVSQGFKIIDLDLRRPWGFYFYFDTKQTTKFAETFFGGVKLAGIDTSLPLQPKVLVFEPGRQVSWQYHYRRSEIWRCITDRCQVIMSSTDEQTAPKQLKFGEVINFTQGVRHRGGAIAGEWGAVAEIWQHTDPAKPSDESDIVRLADDFGRS